MEKVQTVSNLPSADCFRSPHKDQQPSFSTTSQVLSPSCLTFAISIPYGHRSFHSSGPTNERVRSSPTTSSFISSDAGNVNAEPVQYRLLGEREPGFFDIRKSAGVGVRVITPMGVLRFEYGMKLDARDGESPDRFEFTVSGLF